MPTVSKISDFLLHMFRDLQLTNITIKGRSSMSNPMTLRRLNIYRISDLNALIISFNVERSKHDQGDSLMGFVTRHPFQPKNCRFSTETFWRLMFSHEWFRIHLQRDEVELEMNSEPRV